LKRFLFTGIIVMLALFITASLAGCSAPEVDATPPAAENDGQEAESVVRELVTEFGKRLQMVSLLAPEDSLRASLEENYGGLVSSELLSKWADRPENAPGRLVSSPWPDRIEITSIEEVEEGYKVQGKIVEVTSAEEDKPAAERPITLTVTEAEGKWIIVDVVLGDYGTNSTASSVCDIPEYGFRITLPATWAGYSVIEEKWEGYRLDAQGNVDEDNPETGPMVLIRHPKWTEENPRQDIPVMVFTRDQWEALDAGEFHIGAAPINPTELDRNSEYVFALPARYNFAFPMGHEEVEDIIESGAFEAYDNRVS